MSNDAVNTCTVDLTLKPSYGRIVAALRSLYGISQTEFAKQAGIDQANLSRVEAGKYRPSERIAKAVQRNLGVAYPPQPEVLALVDQLAQLRPIE